MDMKLKGQLTMCFLKRLPVWYVHFRINVDMFTGVWPCWDLDNIHQKCPEDNCSNRFTQSVKQIP